MKDMKSLRKKIDRLDKRIVKLLNRRAKYADDIGKIKEKEGLEVYSPEREKQVIENVSRENPGPLTSEAVKRVYERVIDESRRLERESAEERRISFQNRHKGMNRLLDFLRLNNLETGSVRRKVAILIAAIASVVVVLFAVFTIPFHYIPGKGKVLTIDRGMSANEVYSQLADDGFVTNRVFFKIVAKIFSVDHRIKAGKYLFTGHFSDLQVMNLIASGKSNLLVKVTIPEGLTIRQIAPIFHEELGTDPAAFAQVALSDSAASAMNIPSRSLEGYLFPESYDFYYGTDVNEILTRMVDEYREFFNDSLRARAGEIGYSISQIMRVASIVEAEARVDSERSIIASVYYNRLKKNIPLEADPTIEYAIGEHKRIYYKDLQIKSPYNTYERIGLPPTPICNPGRKAILAALYPADTDYLYFVATGKGGHKFSKTFDEHLKAVRAYRRHLRNR
ncbi:MAG TPA: endolytic transglycosylase MltG [Candidatus Kryptonia bacterium]